MSRGVFARESADAPFWQKLEVELTAPPGTSAVSLNFAAILKKGAIWVDDVSLTENGKELLKNGGFEER